MSTVATVKCPACIHMESFGWTEGECLCGEVASMRGVDPLADFLPVLADTERARGFVRRAQRQAVADHLERSLIERVHGDISTRGEWAHHLRDPGFGRLLYEDAVNVAEYMVRTLPWPLAHVTEWEAFAAPDRWGNVGTITVAYGRHDGGNAWAMYGVSREGDLELYMD